MAFSVVIPSNSATRLRKAVKSILDTHPELFPSQIIIVDDGAAKDWSMSDPRVRWVAGIKPFIYARNVNFGIDAAGKDDVVVMGDDVEVATAHAFYSLEEASKRSKVFAVSPAIDGLVGNDLQHRKTMSAVRDSSKPLCFVCIYLTRNALDIVGRLDEQFTAYGGEDLDFGYRIEEAKGRALVDDRCLVFHNHGEDMKSEFRSKPDIIEQSQAALRLLAKKWPDRFLIVK